MIHSLQVYRGFAAILVVLYHASHNLSGYFNSTALSDFFAFGHAGVSFFFVLSGFIIFEIHRGDIGRPQQVKSYLYKRITRIYPAYWLVTLALVPAWLLVPSISSLVYVFIV